MGPDRVPAGGVGTGHGAGSSQRRGSPPCRPMTPTEERPMSTCSGGWCRRGPARRTRQWPVRDVVVLGSTGSIGTQAIDLVLRNPDRFRVTGALRRRRPGRAARRAGAPAAACETVAVAREDAVPALREALSAQYGTGEPLPEILAGPDAATELAASDCHTVLNGITGSIGLAPTLAALEAGRTLALANKESLIVGGPLVKALAQARPDHPGRLRARGALPGAARPAPAPTSASSSSPPPAAPSAAVRRRELADVTVEDALAHPTWAMGPVITINSATLVNKGLEVIEAHLLYDIPFDRIEVVVHPQSYVHSMVEFTDGSTIAQASPPDMRAADRHRPRLARAGARTRPRRSTGPRRRPGTFFPLDTEAFPVGGPRPARGRARAARPRRCSMPPTRSASRRSSPVRCRSTASWRPSNAFSVSTRSGTSRRLPMFWKRRPGRAAGPGSWRGRPRRSRGSEVVAALGVFVFVVALLASIALHEAGHLVTAKKFGMKATQYFLGLGPTLWSTHRGETEYGVKAMPIGGFVKIVGMTQLEDLETRRTSRARSGGRRPAQRCDRARRGVVHALRPRAGRDVRRPRRVRRADRQDHPHRRRLRVPATPSRTPAARGTRVARAGGRRPRGRPGRRVRRHGDHGLGGLRPADPQPAGDRAERRRAAGRRCACRSRSTSSAASATDPKTKATVRGRPDRRQTAGDEGLLAHLGGPAAPRPWWGADRPARRGARQAARRGQGPVLRAGRRQRGTRRITDGGAVGIVDLGRISAGAFEARDFLSVLLMIAGLNVFVGLFNLLPLLPLDGGHLAILGFEEARSQGLPAGRPPRPRPGRPP